MSFIWPYVICPYNSGTPTIRTDICAHYLIITINNYILQFLNYILIFYLFIVVKIISWNWVVWAAVDPEQCWRVRNPLFFELMFSINFKEAVQYYYNLLRKKYKKFVAFIFSSLIQIFFLLHDVAVCSKYTCF